MDEQNFTVFLYHNKSLTHVTFNPFLNHLEVTDTTNFLYNTDEFPDKMRQVNGYSIKVIAPVSHKYSATVTNRDFDVNRLCN